MSEKVESMEIHPMRGHSRGEWYCSLKDVAPSEKEAEYWAVFGVTHRGNKHCLGEFPTKTAAEIAVHGLKIDCKPAVPSQARHSSNRTVVQIEVIASKDSSTMMDLFVLCNDGSIWRRGVGTGRHSGLMDSRWERVPLDGLDELAPGATLHDIIAALH